MTATDAPPGGSTTTSDRGRVRAPDHGRNRLVDLGFLLAIALVFGTVVVMATAMSGSGSGSGGSARPSGGATTSDSMREAESWLVANLAPAERVLLDQAAATDLLGLGVSTQRLAPIPTSGPLPDTLGAWREYDYLVSSPGLRDQSGAWPSVSAALGGSIAVAAFGTGDELVEIRRVVPHDLDEVQQRHADALNLRLRAGAALATNRDIDAPPDVLDLVRSGLVDDRLLSVLAVLSGQHEIQIRAFPAAPGEDAAGTPRRTVEIEAVDGRSIDEDNPALPSAEAFFAAQVKEYRPAEVTVDDRSGGSTVLRVTYAIADPTTAS